MDTENQPPAPAEATGVPSTAPVVPAVKLPVLAPAFTPAAAVISFRPRDKFLEAVAAFKFDGNPRPELVEEAKRVALTLADIAPCDKADQLQGQFEISGFAAHQLRIIVTPSNY